MDSYKWEFQMHPFKNLLHSPTHGNIFQNSKYTLLSVNLPTKLFYVLTQNSSKPDTYEYMMLIIKSLFKKTWLLSTFSLLFQLIILSPHLFRGRSHFVLNQKEINFGNKFNIRAKAQKQINNNTASPVPLSKQLFFLPILFLV